MTCHHWQNHLSFMLSIQTVSNELQSEVTYEVLCKTLECPFLSQSIKQLCLYHRRFRLRWFHSRCQLHYLFTYLIRKHILLSIILTSSTTYAQFNILRWSVTGISKRLIPWWLSSSLIWSNLDKISAQRSADTKACEYIITYLLQQNSASITSLKESSLQKS